MVRFISACDRNEIGWLFIVMAAGYTIPHYTSLNKLMGTYGGKGFNVLGYPCNQFGGQEPGRSVSLSTHTHTHT